jgi:hypothetical protein
MGVEGQENPCGFSMLSAQNFKRAQKHAKILDTKVGDASELDEHEESQLHFILTLDSFRVTIIRSECRMHANMNFENIWIAITDLIIQCLVKT